MSGYLRRVRNPEPMLEELARQVVDIIERWQQQIDQQQTLDAQAGVERRGVIPPSLIASTAADAGVPIAYVLDELERRCREGR